MSTAFRVEARNRAHAACVGAALDAPVSRSRRGWCVHVEAETSADLGRMLAAIQSCLDEQAIPLVTVVLDDERYVMEGTPSSDDVTARRRTGARAGSLSP